MATSARSFNFQDYAVSCFFSGGYQLQFEKAEKLNQPHFVMGNEEDSVQTNVSLRHTIKFLPLSSDKKLFKLNIKNMNAMSTICSKLTIK